MSPRKRRLTARRPLAFALAAAALLASGALYAQTSLQKLLFDDEVAAHWIYDDFEAAQRAAREAGKPILALLRCVP